QLLESIGKKGEALDAYKLALEFKNHPKYQDISKQFNKLNDEMTKERRSWCQRIVEDTISSNISSKKLEMVQNDRRSQSSASHMRAI
ncbi:MAG: hypothetical protein ACK4M7_10870, partial [Burkholderiales bacterium]